MSSADMMDDDPHILVDVMRREEEERRKKHEERQRKQDELQKKMEQKRKLVEEQERKIQQEQAKRLHQRVTDDINAICNSLGKLDENDGTYMKDRDCKPGLKEIIRYLAGDRKDHVVRQAIGSMNLVKSDLIPLMVQYCEYTEGDSELFTTILRLLTNLTSSVLLLFENQEMPKDPDQLVVHNKLLHYLAGYKEAFASRDDIWMSLNTHLRHNREDEITFERLVILLRNILHIPVDSTSDFGTHSDFDAHDMCLHRMHKTGMLDTIIQLAQDSEKGSEFCFHITEIIYLMLRDQNPETIAKAAPYSTKRKLDDDDADKKRYAELRQRDRKEKRLKQIHCLRPTLSRYSSFVVNDTVSVRDEAMVVRGLINNKTEINLDAGKADLKKPKRACPLSSETSMSISDGNIKVSKVSFGLKVFCKKFLENIYNNYMQQIKHNLIQQKAQDHDESYYFWALQFFSAFNRHVKFEVEKISESYSMSTLHFIQISIIKYQESIKMEKKNFMNASRRLHLALRAYREILITIDTLPKDPNSKAADTIRKICSDLDYNCLLLNLFTQYDTAKHSLHYLVDLIKTNRIFLKLYNDNSPTQDILIRYCCPDVLKAYTAAVGQYKTNDSETNLAVIEFFESLVEYGQGPQLYQASLFKHLLEIMNYDERYEKLAKQLFDSFGTMSNRARWMFHELLFWKTSNDIIEIEFAINPPPAPAVPEDEDIPLAGTEQPYTAPVEPDDADERASVVSELPSLAGDNVDDDVESVVSELPSLGDDDEIMDPPEADVLEQPSSPAVPVVSTQEGEAHEEN